MAKNTPKTRTIDFLQKKGISIFNAEKMCGLSRGYLGTGGVMGSDKIAMIKNKFPDYDVNYIVTGKQDSRESELEFYKEAFEKAREEIDCQKKQIDALNKIIKISNN